MTERCNNCGTELFAGQQFCRVCGAPTRQFSTAEIPTQILPGGQAPPAPQPPTAQTPYAGTTPLGARDTDLGYQSREDSGAFSISGRKPVRDFVGAVPK